ncbi:hypothetical protein CYLTODRAFT_419577 [Cylindrobasidium torrendii FP15055 ss-10]|uniref:Uncharacterized protein n=1 Tax=Cylindrobasidium torrendii FP15055 ss-10 TaxID=1314674 RepID=A0A0D7BK57_9AGAR|nr:hypothetical protein CYLTODRAFT_419577 [Cylindrobasidium torrendii FP15055 ss-10]
MDTSRIAHLLKTNDLLSISETSRICKLIQAATVILTDNRDVALHLKLEERIAEYKRLLHPIRYLPDDILREIFGWVVPSVHRPPAWDTLDVRLPPWTLTHVSKNWRAVAISHPLLWNTIIHTDDVLYNTLSPLSIMLARSKGQSLHVEIVGKYVWWRRPLFVPLLRTTPRWEYAKISGPRRYINALSALSFPLLVSLDLHSSDTEIEVSLNAPHLVDVALSGLDAGATRLPWAQIKTYRSRDMKLSHVHKLTSVTTLVIQTTAFRYPADSGHFFDLPSVETLVIRDERGHTSIAPVFGRFNFPSLRVLILDAISDSLYDLPLLPKVTTLVLRLMYYKPSVGRFWKALPGLEALYMAFSQEMDYESDLVMLAKSATLLPRLTMRHRSVYALRRNGPIEAACSML